MFGFLFFVAVLTFLPAPAFAFGPVAHIDMGLDLVAQAAAVGTGAWVLLRDHSKSFLQGTIGPDRELAKNLASYQNHSHNWHRALDRFRGEGDDETRAFFLGYLCHLAADSVAHNYFVPLKMIEAHRSIFAAHVYWEMRMDARSRESGHDSALKALRMNARKHRRFLETVVPGNVLGARFNVRMSGIAMRVQRALAYRAASRLIDRESRLQLADEDIADVRRLAMEAQVSLLKKLEAAPILQVDPRGLAAIARARGLRRQLRDLVRRQGEPNPVAARLVAHSRHELRVGIVGAIRGHAAAGGSKHPHPAHAAGAR